MGPIRLQQTIGSTGWSWRRSKRFPKTKFHQRKIMVSVLWIAIGVTHCRFLVSNSTNIAKVYYKELDEIDIQFSKMRLELVHRRGPILLNDIPRSHFTGITLHKLTNLRYKSFLYSPYSPDLSPHWLNLFSSILTMFLIQEKFSFKNDTETVLKILLAHKPLEFYC